MARKKEPQEKQHAENPNVMGLHAAVVEQPICDTLERNYMPYAMSVIVSRAIPEIDGFKPSHRKLLYTMYKMGLLNGGRTKSANIVGATMKLNPHGDAAIYDTMVRLAKGNEALLTPFIDSKGNFGKVYSRDMSYAAPRYTEAKLAPICQEMFRDIDLDTVDMVDNYDATMKEPALLPTTFPNVLVSSNTGIAVGMASNICGFNLQEVCNTAIAWMQDPSCDLLETLPAPDFTTGGEILYDPREMAEIYRTGRGSFKIRARWRYQKQGNLIEIFEIPYTTTTEAIMDKVEDLVKQGKIREISDMRDETDLSGMKLTIDLKRGVDPEKLMQKLMRSTPLCDSYGCNFNILIAGMPRVLGIREILEEWTAWRCECVRRRIYFQLQKKQEKLHLLQGLQKILLDIDKAIAIIRQTESDAEVVPNLMIGFGIDQIQAEYVAEIKLRNINKEYILKHTQQIGELERQIADLEATLKSERRVRRVIMDELTQVAKKYGQPRRTGLAVPEAEEIAEPEDETPDYPVHLFISQEGYLKKITPQSLRMSGQQRFKEGDSLAFTCQCTNRTQLLVFTDRQQVYKARLAEFKETKASELGDFLASKLEMEPEEQTVAVCLPEDYRGFVLFAFANGKVAKVDLAAYDTKSNRRRLTGAYSDKAPLIGVQLLREETEIVLQASDGRAVLFSTAQLALKATRSTQGVAVMSLKKKATLARMQLASASGLGNQTRYRAKSIPAAGSLLRPEDIGQEQISLEL